jgi:hypothetical protein
LETKKELYHVVLVATMTAKNIGEHIDRLLQGTKKPFAED